MATQLVSSKESPALLPKLSVVHARHFGFQSLASRICTLLEAEPMVGGDPNSLARLAISEKFWSSVPSFDHHIFGWQCQTLSYLRISNNNDERIILHAAIKNTMDYDWSCSKIL